MGAHGQAEAITIAGRLRSLSAFRVLKTSRFLTWAFQALVVALAYYVAARLSLRLALVERNVTAFWPPTGIALVAFLLLGRRVWPAIAAAAFFVNLSISPTALAAAQIAVGNTLAPLVAALLLSTVGFRSDLSRLRDAAALVFLAALPSTLISASIGTSSLVLSGAVAIEDFLPTWSVWWTGDAMGILVVAPVLLTVRSVRIGRPRRWDRTIEILVLIAALAGASVLILTRSAPLLVVVFPPLGWAAWRYQERGAAPAVLLVSTIATWAASHDQGPFSGLDLLDKMLALQAFNASVSFTSLFLGSVVAERLQAEADRRRLLERERQTQLERYQREHRIAEALQRSLLPEQLADAPDVPVAARYIPASTEVEVGGDWYDVIPLADGRVAVAIGDVAGHGIPAAAAMGQLRTALRAYALEMLPPARALERLNAVLHELQPEAMATVFYLQLDPRTGEAEFASAGHPPPLVISGNGTSRFLEDGLSPPIGVAYQPAYKEAATRLEAGDSVLLYTDGLIEQRGQSIDARLDLLKRAATEAPADLEDLCDHIVAALLADDIEDDAALLAIRRASLKGLPLRLRRAAEPATAGDIRRVLRRWLNDNGVPDKETFDVLVACGEACANAIQHAYSPAGGIIEVDAEIDQGAVLLRVRDRGTWRAANPSAPAGAGRGFQLMRGTMDTVDVSTGQGGTLISMARTFESDTSDA